MVISLKELARAPQQTICFDYNMDLSKEELNFEFPFKEPVKNHRRDRRTAGCRGFDCGHRGDGHHPVCPLQQDRAL